VCIRLEVGLGSHILQTKDVCDGYSVESQGGSTIARFRSGRVSHVGLLLDLHSYVDRNRYQSNRNSCVR
jgi:hypothetical protein